MRNARHSVRSTLSQFFPLCAVIAMTAGLASVAAASALATTARPAFIAPKSAPGQATPQRLTKQERQAENSALHDFEVSAKHYCYRNVSYLSLQYIRQQFADQGPIMRDTKTTGVYIKAGLISLLPARLLDLPDEAEIRWIGENIFVVEYPKAIAFPNRDDKAGGKRTQLEGVVQHVFALVDGQPLWLRGNFDAVSHEGKKTVRTPYMRCARVDKVEMGSLFGTIIVDQKYPLADLDLRPLE